LALAERYDAYIIEDDYVSGLDFENMGLPPLNPWINPTELYFSKVFPRFYAGTQAWLYGCAVKP